MTSHHALREQLLRATTAELRRRIAEGGAVAPAAIEGFTYRGTSLGLPRVVERLTWKTFQKCFWRHPDSGRLLGWNVRLQQDGIDAPSRPKTNRGGEPITTWFYEVLDANAAPLPSSWPSDFTRGLIIDYARVPNPLINTVRLVKDPLVDIGDGSGDLLLGVSAVPLPGLCVETPTYFLLERESAIVHVPDRMRLLGQPARAPALLPFERRISEQLFDAILGVEEPATSGLPAFASLDHGGFWQAVEQRTAPHVAAGLRATVHALNAAPLAMSGVHRPLCALSRAERIASVERLGEHPGYLVRQMLATMKILACFAYFEHDAVRVHLGGDVARAKEQRSCAA